MYTPARLTRSTTAMLYGVTMFSFKGGCVIIPLIAISYAQEMCYTREYGGRTSKVYCEFNCCGITSSYCCDEPGTSKTGLIAGLVVGILVVIAVVVGVVIFCLYRRRKLRRQSEKVPTHEDDISTVSEDDSYLYKGPRAPPPPDPYYLPPVEMKRLPDPPNHTRSSSHRATSTSSATGSAVVTDI